MTKYAYVLYEHDEVAEYALIKADEVTQHDTVLDYYYRVGDSDVHSEDIIKHWQEKHEFLRNLTEEQVGTLNDMIDQMTIYSYMEGMQSGAAEERFMQYRLSLKNSEEQK